VISDALKRLVYRGGYHVLFTLAALRPPRGRGVKAIVCNDGEIALVRHTYGPREWELPGGGVRRGEELLAALRRELREEVAIEADVATPLGSHPGPGRHSRIEVSYFALEVAERELVPDRVEIAEIAWFAPAALPDPLGWHAAEALRRHGQAVASLAQGRHASPADIPGSPRGG
jgi:8-oxo-dGTP pyrophosphatase MutT (NUDIX family)